MIRQTIGSAVFTLYLFVSVPLYGIAVLVTAPLPHRVTYGAVKAWVNSVLFLLERLCGIRYEIEGIGNLPDRPTVVLMKHSSAWETLAQFQLFPTQTWVLKRELMWAPVLGWVLALLRPIAINRQGGHTAVQRVIRQGQERLARGWWVIVYPEGTRVLAGETRRYGISGALLAIAAGKPVLPVAHDSGDYWPRRGWRKRPGTVTVRIGPAIPTVGRDARDVTADVKTWIEATVAEIRRAKAASCRTAAGDNEQG